MTFGTEARRISILYTIEGGFNVFTLNAVLVSHGVLYLLQIESVSDQAHWKVKFDGPANI